MLSRFLKKPRSKIAGFDWLSECLSEGMSSRLHTEYYKELASWVQKQQKSYANCQQILNDALKQHVATTTSNVDETAHNSANVAFRVSPSRQGLNATWRQDSTGVPEAHEGRALCK